MKSIPDYMDLNLQPTNTCGEPCPSNLDEYFQSAFTAVSLPEVKARQNVLLRIQGQCCKHIHTLTIQEDIHRTFRETDGTEFVEQDYTDLITFIANIGAACGKVIERLDGYEHSTLEAEQLINSGN